MEKHAIFDDEGFPVSFYSSEIHGDYIPVDAVQISYEQWLEFISHPSLRRWEDGQVVEYIPPVVEIPEVFPPITKRQLRLTLVRNGISLSGVESAIASMPEGLSKEEARIEWADASTFNRNHPTLLLIASALGLTEAQVDAMWREAVTA